MRKKVFFLICLGLVFQMFSGHVCGMKPRVKPEEKGVLKKFFAENNKYDDLVAYKILAFLPFGDEFFEYVAKLDKGVPKVIFGKLPPKWLRKYRKCSFLPLLVASCCVRPMVLEIYGNREEIKEKDSCHVKRSGEWFWKNFSKIRKLLNGVLSETILIFHYRLKQVLMGRILAGNCLLLQDFEKISSLTNLRGLDLNNCSLDDEKFVDYEDSPFKMLKKFKNLKFLGLCLTLPVDTLQVVSEEIEALNLADCCCMEGLGFLSRFKKLKALDLSGTSLGAKEVAFLNRSEKLQENLEELRLRANEYYSFVEDFSFLAKFENLKILDLGNTSIKTKELESFANSKKLQRGLKKLGLLGCRCIDSFGVLIKFKNLEVLILSETHIKQQELIFIINSSNLKNSLKVLEFDKCNLIYDDISWQGKGKGVK